MLVPFIGVFLKRHNYFADTSILFIYSYLSIYSMQNVTCKYLNFKIIHHGIPFLNHIKGLNVTYLEIDKTFRHANTKDVHLNNLRR
jgi:hypothetical protein